MIRALPFGEDNLVAGDGAALLVREEGLEPSRCFQHWHLKPARLPITATLAYPGEPSARLN